MKNLTSYLLFIAIFAVSVFSSYKLIDSLWLTALIFVIVGVILIPLMLCDGYFYSEEICFFFSIIGFGGSCIVVFIKHYIQQQTL